GRNSVSGFASDFTLGFTVAGTPAAGPETRANTFTNGSQVLPAVAADAAGDYVVAWQSYGQPGGNNSDVYAQRYSAAGVPQGPEFRVNTFTTSDQLRPAVALSPAGDFVIAWDSLNQPGGNGFDVYAQRYGATGVPLGVEFRVNAVTTNSQKTPAVAADAAGDFVVAWDRE